MTVLRRAVWFAAASLVLFAASTAVAAPSAPGGLASSAGVATAAGTTTFSWRPAATDPAATVIRYEGGLTANAAAEPAVDFGLSTSAPASLGAPGIYVFKVRAVQSDLLVGPYSTLAMTVDRTAPEVTVTFPPANGLNGWHVGPSGLRITPKCIDATAVTGCVPATWTAQTRGATQSFTVADAAGNSTTRTSATFLFDRIAPTPRGVVQPGPNATLSAEPTYTWTRFDDGTSGTDHYEVLYRIGNSGPYSTTLLATAPHPPPGALTTVSTVRNVLATPLPSGQDIWWRVRTFDRAGNWSLTIGRRLRIDPAIPPAPTITGGPSGATNVAAPTFSWTGDQPNFTWDVTGPDQDVPVQSGSGSATQVTLKALIDGDYTFRVSRGPSGSPASAEATRAFEVDTVAPPAPAITSRPPNPTVGLPAFAWTTAAAAFGRWTVVGAGGAAIQGPSDAPMGNVVLGGLGAGTYDFRLVAIDPAGNASSAVSEPFAISIAAAAARPIAAKRSPALLTQNANRLRPRPGFVMTTRRPILRWLRGPSATTLYNVQLFRVGSPSAAGRQTLKKIVSSFPRRTRLRPERPLTPGACYIWRVWPYLGSRFDKKPLGISNFCVAGTKVLRAKAKAVKVKARR